MQYHVVGQSPGGVATELILPEIPQPLTLSPLGQAIIYAGDATNTPPHVLFVSENGGPWTVLGGTGGVAGADTQVQYNKAGVMAADAGFTWGYPTAASPGLKVTSTGAPSFTRTLASTVTSQQSAATFGLSGAGVPNAGAGPSALFSSWNSASAVSFLGRVSAVWENPSSTAEAASLVFSVRANHGDTFAQTEVFRANSLGHLLVGSTTDNTSGAVMQLNGATCLSVNGDILPVAVSNLGNGTSFFSDAFLTQVNTAGIGVFYDAPPLVRVAGIGYDNTLHSIVITGGVSGGSGIVCEFHVQATPGNVVIYNGIVPLNSTSGISNGSSTQYWYQTAQIYSLMTTPLSLSNPPSGFGGMTYAGGSTYDVWNANTTTWMPIDFSAVGLPASDATHLMFNAGDPTKQLALNLSALSTFTTRTWSVQDHDMYVAGINIQQTFTADQTFQCNIFPGSGTFDIGNTTSYFSDAFITTINTAGLGFWFSGIRVAGFGYNNSLGSVCVSGGIGGNTIMCEFHVQSAAGNVIVYNGIVPLTSSGVLLGSPTQVWSQTWTQALYLTFTGTPSHPPSGSGGFYYSGSGSTYEYFDGSNWIPFIPGAGGSPPFTDAFSLLYHSTDSTRQLQFSLAGISPSTTRIWTIQNQSLTVAGIDVAQTWSAIQTYSTNIYTGATTDIGQVTAFFGNAFVQTVNMTQAGFWIGSTRLAGFGYNNSLGSVCVSGGIGGNTIMCEFHVQSAAGNIIVYNGVVPLTASGVLLGQSGQSWSQGWIQALYLTTPTAGTPPFPPSGSGGFYFNGTSYFYYNSGAWSVFSPGGSSQPFIDAAPIAYNAATPSKQLQFSLSSISASTIRTWTAQDHSMIVAGIDVAQTWLATQTFQNIYPAVGTFDIGNTTSYFSNAFLTTINTAGLGFWFSGTRVAGFGYNSSLGSICISGGIGGNTIMCEFHVQASAGNVIVYNGLVPLNSSSTISLGSPSQQWSSLYSNGQIILNPIGTISSSQGAITINNAGVTGGFAAAIYATNAYIYTDAGFSTIGVFATSFSNNQAITATIGGVQGVSIRAGFGGSASNNGGYLHFANGLNTAPSPVSGDFSTLPNGTVYYDNSIGALRVKISGSYVSIATGTGSGVPSITGTTGQILVNGTSGTGITVAATLTFPTTVSIVNLSASGTSAGSIFTSGGIQATSSFESGATGSNLAFFNQTTTSSGQPNFFVEGSGQIFSQGYNAWLSTGSYIGGASPNVFLSYSVITSISITSGLVVGISGSSDSRLKDLIEPYAYGMREIRQLRPWRYRYSSLFRSLYNAHDHCEHIGFLADREVLNFMPKDTGLDSNGYYTHNDRGVTAALVVAIQEKDAEIQDLKYKLSALVAQLTTNGTIWPSA